MIAATIFDMDGLLVDSEPLWRRAEVEVFAEVGLHIEEDDCRATTGLRIDEVCRHWHARSPFEGATPDEVATRIVDRMVERVPEEGRALPGVAGAVARCRARGPVAVASSSPLRLIEATLAHLGLDFEVVISAESEPYGKPHPAVFLTTAERLGVDPARCLVLEDSVNGMVAAKAARATCVAIPAVADRGDPRFGLADLVLDDLDGLDDAALDRLRVGDGARTPG